MNIIHRLRFDNDGPAAEFFRSRGFRIEGDLFTAFDIGENDPRWEQIEIAMQRYGPSVIHDFQYRTEFTPAELRQAQFLVLSGRYLFEYPQPDGDFGYQETTYKPGIGCRKCGMNLVQNNPFSVKRTPTWGRRNIVQLNWVFGEYFVSRQIKDKLEDKIPGLTFREVLKYPRETVIDDMFQLAVESRVRLTIPTDAAYQVCEVCKAHKYSTRLISHGFLPRPREDSFSIARSEEWFGDGGVAYPITIVSKRAYGVFVEAGIKGLDFLPCA